MLCLPSELPRSPDLSPKIKIGRGNRTTSVLLRNSEYVTMMVYGRASQSVLNWEVGGGGALKNGGSARNFGRALFDSSSKEVLQGSL